jgi:2-hydroxychromene-2-carboxylate isomerase
MTPTLDFWFDCASTYSYLTAMRIEAEAAKQAVAVRWRPFLLGAIFKAKGWASSPFNLDPVKGRYMVCDVTRIARARGLAFHLPDPFPQNSLAAARLTLALRTTGQDAAFARAVFHAEFAQQQQIDDPAVLNALIAGLGRDPGAVTAWAGRDEIKALLRAETQAATAAGIFGAPSFTTSDGDLFWGDDRLDHALEHARALRTKNLGSAPHRHSRVGAKPRCV